MSRGGPSCRKCGAEILRARNTKSATVIFLTPWPVAGGHWQVDLDATLVPRATWWPDYAWPDGKPNGHAHHDDVCAPRRVPVLA